jgi:hypothetical protein
MVLSSLLIEVVFKFGSWKSMLFAFGFLLLAYGFRLFALAFVTFTWASRQHVTINPCRPERSAPRMLPIAGMKGAESKDPNSVSAIHAATGSSREKIGPHACK